MNKQDFNKAIMGLKNIRMTDAEKKRMLERIFATPIKSPYMMHMPAFALACSLFLIVSFGGATYVSGTSLPGDTLYPLKVGVVEPMLDVVYRAPAEKIVWEEEKVERRIAEAEGLAKKNRLDDKKFKELERKIEKSSTAFAKAAGSVASTTSTSTSSAKKKKEDLKNEFRRKINEREEIPNGDDELESAESESESEKEASDKKRADRKEKIKRLQDTAVRFVDENDDEDEDEEEDRENMDDN